MKKAGCPAQRKNNLKLFILTFLFVNFLCIAVRADSSEEKAKAEKKVNTMLQEKKKNTAGDHSEVHTQSFYDDMIGEGQKMHEKETDEEEKKRLSALGYLPGYRPGPEEKNVTIYDEEKAFNGLNLYISGHGPEAFLIDMHGKVLHSWRYPGGDENGPCPVPVKYFRRARLFKNGDLGAILSNCGLLKIDKNSNLIWAYEQFCHHDFHVDEEGKIFVLISEDLDLPGNDHITYMDELIAVLTPDGKEIRRVSLWECFKNSFFAPALDQIVSVEVGFGAMPIKPGKKIVKDIFHVNTLEIFDGKHRERSEIFKKGNALISMRNPSMTAIVDMEKEKIVWMMTGMWKHQHQPTLLDNGNILIFDNEGRNGNSRVFEFDPLSQKVGWIYRGENLDVFVSKFCGSNQRLPNGNTLITDSVYGRAVEVLPDGTIVWKFVNPHRTGKEKNHIGTLFEVIRITPDFPLTWLAGN